MPRPNKFPTGSLSEKITDVLAAHIPCVEQDGNGRVSRDGYSLSSIGNNGVKVGYITQLPEQYQAGMKHLMTLLDKHFHDREMRFEGSSWHISVPPLRKKQLEVHIYMQWLE